MTLNLKHLHLQLLLLHSSSLASTPKKSVTPSSFLSARKSSAVVYSKSVKPTTHRFTSYELHALSIRACLDLVPLKELDLFFYVSLDKLCGLVQYCTIIEYH
ncbi:hypothetical protein BDR26DRAFT_449242 [Obelidium mucronatum]|nr:hypothetical protein BDR26DRAFT_449242 [Obelidium mucronatum]